MPFLSFIYFRRDGDGFLREISGILFILQLVVCRNEEVLAKYDVNEWATWLRKFAHLGQRS